MKLRRANPERRSATAIQHSTRVDPDQADVVLDVTCTFAGDYLFEIKDRSTSMALLAGKGSGPFSVPAGATSVAKELVKLASPCRMEHGTN